MNVSEQDLAAVKKQFFKMENRRVELLNEFGHEDPEFKKLCQYVGAMFKTLEMLGLDKGILRAGLYYKEEGELS